MYEFLFNFHSGWAYLVLLLTVLLLAAILYHYFTKKPIHHNIRRIAFYTVLSFHIQFLIGLTMLLYRIFVMSDNMSMGDTMSNAPLRLIYVEHPLMMFTAVILMTIANSKIKKNQFVTTSILVFLILACLCFYMIPWTQWLNV